MHIGFKNRIIQKPRPVKVVKKQAKANKEYRAKSYTTIISSPGIYKIECTQTNSVYIGQSKNIGSRLDSHFFALKSGKHTVGKLQEDYNKFPDHFLMESVFETDEQDLLKLETFYIDQFKRWGFDIYNVIHNTEDATILHCPQQFKGVVQKIVKLLDSGKISKHELEQSISYKENGY